MCAVIAGSLAGRVGVVNEKGVNFFTEIGRWVKQH